MALSSVSLAYGNVSFAAEAENENWLSQQLDKFLDLAKTLPQQVANPPNAKPVAVSPSKDSEKFNGTLASHLKAKGSETNQNKRFLATADWLRLRGNEKLSTAMVTKALGDNHQKRLGNSSDCLNQNVAKGFCEKTSGGFYITPDGLKDLGYD
jgi:hypothetical protein